MHTTASYIPQSNVYPSFLSYTRSHDYFNNSIGISTSSTYYNGYSTGLDLSNNNKQIEDNDENDNESTIPCKKRSRTVPNEEKDDSYYEKRSRNNESAKRSREARRIKEQDIQQRVILLEHENSRLLRENQAIRYRISQFQALYDGIPKP